MRKTLFTLLLLPFITLTASAQTVYYVNIATGSDFATGTSWATAFHNLTKALSAANATTDAEVQIWIAQGTYTPVDGVASLPANASDTSFVFCRGNGVGKALKVYGGFAGTETSITARDTSHTTTLDGIVISGNSYHIGVIVGLAAAADSVVLDCLTFTNGFAQTSGIKTFNGYTTLRTNGGALYMEANYSSKIAVRKCRFYGCKALGTYNYPTFTYGGNAYGGAVFNNISNCSFDSCRFVSNTAQGNTGGDAVGGTGVGGNGLGGGLYVNSGTAIVNGCTFLNNYAIGGLGDGAISAYGGNGSGGGCYIATSTSSRLTNNTFVYNITSSGPGHQSYGSSHGGGLFTLSSTTIVIKCSFTGNRAVDSIGGGSSSIFGNECSGGAIYNKLSTTNYDSCLFTKNIARAANFNICRGSGVYDTSSTVDYTNCAFSFNTYLTNGYGTAAFCNSSSTTFTNCDIDSNNVSVGASYGAIYNYNGARTSLINCRVNSNTNDYGGGVTNNNANLRLSKCIFNNNKAYTSGGGIYNTNNASSLVTIDSCTFTNNNAGNNSGGAIWHGVNTIMSPTHCLFSGNSSFSEGGAIYVEGNASVTAGSLSSIGNTYLFNKSRIGGAIRINACPTCTDTILNNIFLGNKSTDAASGGGAILVGDSRNYICNNTFAYDSAANRGGAIRYSGTSGILRVVNNIFYNSVANGTSVDTSISGTGSFFFSNNIYTGTNPLFVNISSPSGSDALWGTTDDGLALQPCSPGINGGNAVYIFPNEPKDIAGNTRVIGGLPDIGAFERVTIGVITSPSYICIGSSVTLTDTTSGGSWSTSAPLIATITPTGYLTALATGSATITYTHTGACSTDIATASITIERPVSNLTIASGNDTLCVSTSMLLADSVAGGIWSSVNPAIASVNTTGNVFALSSGRDTIAYTLTNSCGTTTARIPLLVERRASAITGIDTVCYTGTFTYLDSVVGGVWSVTNAALATINASTGLLNGLHYGRDTIAYTLTNSCGVSSTSSVTYLARNVASLSGPDSVCVPVLTSFHDSVAGGTWTHTNTALLLNPFPAAANLYAYATGVDTIIYTLTNACGTSVAYKTVRIDTIPTAIYGPDSVCTGTSISLSNGTAGGNWYSLAPIFATVSTTGVVSGLISGSAVISYTIINACPAAPVTKTIYIHSAPSAPIIYGAFDTVCEGNTINFSSSASSGTWSVSNSHGSIDATGTLYGSSPGRDTVLFILTNTCGSTVATFPITVYSAGHCDSALAIAAIQGNVSNLTIYPNPANTQLTIEYASRQNETVEALITDIMGRKMTELLVYPNRPNKYTIDLPSGVYIITVSKDNINYITRLVVE